MRALQHTNACCSSRGQGGLRAHKQSHHLQSQLHNPVSVHAMHALQHSRNSFTKALGFIVSDLILLLAKHRLGIRQRRCLLRSDTGV